MVNELGTWRGPQGPWVVQLDVPGTTSRWPGTSSRPPTLAGVETVYLRRGQPLFHAMTRVFAFLDHRPRPRYFAGNGNPARSSDEELRRDAYELVRKLVQNTGQDLIRRSYAQGVHGDPGFMHPLPTNVPDHVLTLLTVAADGAGIATGGLGGWASTAALAQLRLVYESYALVDWLLDGTEAEQRERGYALTDDAIDLLRKDGTHWAELTKRHPSAKAPAQRYAAPAATMKQDIRSRRSPERPWRGRDPSVLQLGADGRPDLP